MFEKFTECLRKVMSIARQEAQLSSSAYIGTEHLLIGICKERRGVAAQILTNMKVDLEDLLLATRQLIKPVKVPPGTLGQLPFSPGAKTIIVLAGEASVRIRSDVIGTEHLLLGLLQERKGLAFQILQNAGVDSARVESVVVDVMGTADEAAKASGACNRCNGTGREPSEAKQRKGEE
jgi:ATP-dependent Clp protease ATP-binding subunit ClpC